MACGSCREGYDGSNGRCCSCREGRARAYRMWLSFERERESEKRKAGWRGRRGGKLVRLADEIEEFEGKS